MGPHLPLLVGEDAKFAAGHGAAEQDKAGDLILGEIRVGVVVLDDAFEQTSGAGKAASLTADDGEFDTAVGCGVEDVFIRAAVDGAEAFGRFKDDTKAPLLGHAGFDATAYGL